MHSSLSTTAEEERGASFAAYAVRTGEVGLEQMRVSCRRGCSRRAADNVADWVG